MDRRGGNNGTLVGGNTTIDTSFVYGRSMQFDGSNDYVNFGDVADAEFNSTQAWAISMWVKPSASFSGTYLAKRVSGGAGWYFYTGSVITDGAVIEYYDGSAFMRAYTGNYDVSPGNWSHLVMIKQGLGANQNNYSVYVNGIDKTTFRTAGTPGNANFGTSNLQVGATAAASLMKGMIDEVMIFNRTLSTNEINELYVKGRALWNYSAYQNLSAIDGNDNRSINFFSFSRNTTNLLPSFMLSSDGNKFYSPILPATLGTSSAGQAIVTDYVLVGECTSLNDTNVQYRLNRTLTATGTCITINGQNVTFDGQGNTIYYGNSTSSSTYGIRLSATEGTYEQNITIKNVRVEKTTGTGSSTYGIYSQTVNNVTVENSTVITNGTGSGYAIYFYGGSSHKAIGNTLETYMGSSTSDSNYAINLNANAGNNITGNVMHSRSRQGYAVYTQGAPYYSTIQNNSIIAEATGSATSGIYSNLAHSFIIGNVINSTAPYDAIGITASGTGAHNLSVTNNTIITHGTSSPGIYIGSPGDVVRLRGNQFNASGDGIFIYLSTASIGSRINITSYDNFVWGRNVTVYGGGSNLACPTHEVIDASNSGHISLLNCYNVTVSNYQNQDGEKDSLYLYETNFSTLESINASNVPIGARITLGGNNTIKNSNFHITGSTFFANFGAWGIWLESNNNSIVGNNVTTTALGTGSYPISDGGYSVVTGNRLTLIRDNYLSSNGSASGSAFGIRITTGLGNVTIINNTLFSGYRCYGSCPNSYGIIIQSGNAKVYNNTIVTNGTSANHAIYLDTGTDTVIKGNTLVTFGSSSSNYGIYALSGARSTIIEENIIRTGSSSSGTTNIGIRSDAGTLGGNIIQYNNISAYSGGVNGFGFYIVSNHNNTIAYNFVNTTGTTDSDAFYIQNAQNSSFIGNIIVTNGTTNSSDAFYLIDSVWGNYFINNTLLSIKGQGFRIDRSSTYPRNNTLVNNTFGDIRAEHVHFLDASINETYFKNQQITKLNFTGIGGIIEVESSAHGKIRFIVPVNDSYANFSDVVQLYNRSIFFNDTVSNRGLNKSANLTFYNQPTRTELLLNGISCSGPSCNNLTALDAGTIIYNVSYAGNYSFAAAAESDSTAPVVTVNFPTNTTYTSLPLNFNISLNENGSIVHYTLNTWATNNSMSSSDNRNYNASNGTISDGSYVFRVFANDSSGNANTSVSVAFSVDRILPNLTIMSPANITYTSNNITVNFSASDSNSINTQWFMNDTGNTTYSGVLYQVASQGSHTWRFYANDSNGNVNFTSVTFSVDSIVPVPSFVSPSESTSMNLSRNLIHVNVSVSENNLQTIVVRLYNSSGIVFTNTSTTSSFYLNYSGLNDGIYSFNATANDTAGNVNDTETRIIRIDTIQPVVSIAAPLNQTYTSVQSTLDYSVSDAQIKTCWYSLNLGVTNTTVACGTNVSGLNSGQGSSTWRVYANDSAGNTNSTSVTFFIDSVNPSVQFVEPSESNASSIIARQELYVNVTASDTNFANLTIRLFNSSGIVNTSTTSGTGLYLNYSGLNDGTYRFNASVSDTFGNVNSTETRTVSIAFDVDVPSISFVSPTPGANSYLSQDSLPINVSASDNVAVNTITVYVYNSTALIQTNRSSSTSILVNLTSLAEGLYQFNASVNDTVGNRNAIALRNVTLDRTLPVVNVSNPGTGVSYTSNSRSVTFEYTASELYLSSCSLVVNSTTLATNSSANSTEGLNQFVQSFSPGTFVWNVSCVDSAGNINISATRSFTIVAEETSSTPSVSAGGGGGGGGAGGASASIPVTPEVEILQPELSISGIVGQETTREITLRNTGSTPARLTIEIIGLEGILATDPVIILAPGEERTLELRVNVLEKGLQTGIVVFSSGTYREEVPIVLNARTDNFLFDAAVTLSDVQRVIAPGAKLVSQFNLLQVGPQEKVDVYITYIIKDFAGNMYLEESETFYVLGAKDYLKEFPTHNLPEGKYILGMELAYPGAFATSSVQFEIRPAGIYASRLAQVLIAGIVLVVAAIVVALWAFRRPKRLIRKGKL
ncbi:right-handed parallel beta-helix repeat-containing protein [Candidatus Pacearchaeota archaeon]|nr:right-handed parallel beta-helix repeat-containing protein [Candidatus Pacearchaeota archaeon]